MTRDASSISSARLALTTAKLRAAHPDAELLGSEPIAITGIGCRFPGGASSADSYWDLLRRGVDAVREIPADRWDAGSFFSTDVAAPGQMNGRWGGFLDDVDSFDPMFFGVSPREAVNMDPQQRLLLEVAWEALWDAGHAPASLAGSSTGVFIAIYNTDYARLLLKETDAINAHTCAGASHSMGSGRISFLLDLRGPSVSIDTACSSSLMAVHLACQSLRAGDCRTALAGGVSVMLTPEHYLSLSKLNMLSPDGRCKTFDAGADGFVPRRGLRRRGAEAAGRRAGRRRPHPRRHPRLGGEPGRPHERADRAERTRAARRDSRGAGERARRAGRDRVRRDARHRNVARRSDRGRGAGGRASAAGTQAVLHWAP